MKSILWTGAILLWAAAVSGCSALTSASEFANHPPPHGLLVAPPVIAKTEPATRVIVYRDGTFVGSANNRWLSLNKQLIASLMPLQRVEFDVSPGRYEVGSHCFAWGQWKEQLVTFEARAGTTVRYLLSNCAKVSEMTESEARLWNQSQLVKVGP